MDAGAKGAGGESDDFDAGGVRRGWIVAEQAGRSNLAGTLALPEPALP